MNQNSNVNNQNPPPGRRRPPQGLLNRLAGALDVVDLVAIPLGPPMLVPPHPIGDDDAAADAPPPGPADVLNRIGESLAAVVGAGPFGLPVRAVGGAGQAMSPEVAAREERNAIEDDKRQLLKDAERLRKWKDRLQGDNKILREESARMKTKMETLEKKAQEMKKEMKELKKNYEKMLQEKVALAEQISGPAKLPLEILLTIGGFVAGNNNYGTLLSFTLMSKRIKEEMKPVFYETVFLSNAKDMIREPGDGGKRYLDAYKFTKFAYTTRDVEFLDFRSIFPNLHLKLELVTGSGARAATTTEIYSGCEARLTIYRPVRSTTLVSLLSTPVKWKNSYATFHQPIQAVFALSIFGNGALIGDHPRNGTFLIRNLVRDCTITFPEDFASHAQLQETVHELGRLVPVVPRDVKPARRGAEAAPLLRIITIQEEVLDAWIDSLPDVLRRQSFISVHLNMSGDLEEGGFQEKMMAATTAYDCIWNDIKQHIKKIRNQSAFLTLDYIVPRPEDAEDNDEGVDDLTLYGTLKYVRATGSFVTKISELNEITGGETTLLNQAFVAGRA